MARLVQANEATAARRRVFFDLRLAADGITPATSEAGGQPQISIDGAAWTNTGISTLASIGNGRYSADLSQAAVATAGARIETRYASGAAAESPGDAVQVVAYDPVSAIALLGASGVTVVSPVAPGGAVTITRGDAYVNADGRALPFTATGQPDFTGASVAFTVLNGADGSTALGPLAGVVAVPTGSVLIRVDVTAAQTLSLTAARPYRYTLVVTLADGNPLTFRGTLTVQGR